MRMNRWNVSIAAIEILDICDFPKCRKEISANTTSVNSVFIHESNMEGIFSNQDGKIVLIQIGAIFIQCCSGYCVRKSIVCVHGIKHESHAFLINCINYTSRNVYVMYSNSFAFPSILTALNTISTLFQNWAGRNPEFVIIIQVANLIPQDSR